MIMKEHYPVLMSSGKILRASGIYTARNSV
jgi:hypothetical protein